jgi:hypothetical protein
LLDTPKSGLVTGRLRYRGSSFFGPSEVCSPNDTSLGHFLRGASHLKPPGFATISPSLAVSALS